MYPSPHDPCLLRVDTGAPWSTLRKAVRSVVKYRLLLQAPRIDWWPGRPKKFVGRVICEKSTAPLAKNELNPLVVGVLFASRTAKESIGSRFFRYAAPNP